MGRKTPGEKADIYSVRKFTVTVVCVNWMGNGNVGINSDLDALVLRILIL